MKAGVFGLRKQVMMAAVVGGATVLAAAVRVDRVGATTRLWRVGDAAPFAEFGAPKDVTLKVQTKDDSPFVFVEVAPLAGPRTVGKVGLPALRLAPGLVPADAVSLGTAGLLPPEQNPGSYMFLAVARPRTRAGVVAAWLTSRHASGIVFSGRTADAVTTLQPELQYGRLELAAGEDPRTRAETFVIGAFDDCRLGLEAYADAIKKEFNVRLNRQLSGYCTWYSNKHGGAGNAPSTHQFAEAVKAKHLKDWGFDFFQIDDHWQLGCKTNGPAKNFTGANPRGPYPAGMKPTADDLKAKGIVAGLWFMPFAGSQLDPYYADKQEWFVKSAVDYPAPGVTHFPGVRQRKGAPYETAWGGTCLDMTDKAVERYVHDEVDRIANQWGYRYFKYDGTWTAMACRQIYVNDGYKEDDYGQQIFDDPTKTNMEVFRKGLQMVRDAAGADVFIMSCNVSQNMRTMGGVYGLADAVRIGPDNGASWRGICQGPIRGSARYFYNGRVWYNDPDPVYVRNSIPLAHARAICSWAAIAGQLYAFSDWLPDLSEDRVEVLRRTMSPHRLYAQVRPVDLFESPLANVWALGDGETKVYGFFNWEEKMPLSIDYPAAYAGLDPAKTYVGFDFWNNTWVEPFKGSLTMNLPPASCRVLALVPLADHPVLVSTSHHVCAPLKGIANLKWNAAKRTLSGTAEVVAGEGLELRIACPPGFIPAERAALEVSNAKGSAISFVDNRLRASFVGEKTGTANWTVHFAGSTR